MKKINIIILPAACLWALSICGCGNSLSEKKEPVSATTDTAGQKVSRQFLDLLFADQSVEEVGKIADKSGASGHGGMADFSPISQLIAEKRMKEAEIMLRQMTKDKDAESRIKLWAWNGLREIGIIPPKPEVLGVVIEVPIQQQMEYLAIYKDGRVRYVNYTGSLGIWEAHKKEMDSLTHDAIDAAQDIIMEGMSLESPRKAGYTDSLRVSFLTSRGLFQTERSMDIEKNDRLQELFMTGIHILNMMTDEKDKKDDTVLNSHY